MPLGQFLFQYLHARGVRHSFGVPGDFALPTFAWLDKSPIQHITMTHEPGAGFAADAYARLNGIGLVCVTYCVGGLNVLNAIAGAYAEKSPVVVVSGAPGRKDREKDPLLHHKVKTFETQRRVYDEVTVASAVLLDEQTAAAEIIRVVDASLKHKRPVYIEMPHDMVDREIPIPLSTQNSELRTQNSDSDASALAAALEETRSFLARARRPVILAGVELHRYNLIEPVLKFAEALNIPIAADLLSKSVVAESHPLYLGVYGGAMSSDEPCRQYVESADAVLMLGTFITDMSMGIYTAKLDQARVLLATTEQIRIHYHRYEDIQFPDFLNGLLQLAAPQRPHHKSNGNGQSTHKSEIPNFKSEISNLKSQISNLKSGAEPAIKISPSHRASQLPMANDPLTTLRPFPFRRPNPPAPPAPLTREELTEPLTMTELLRIVALHLDEHCCVVSDVGDAIFGAVGIRTLKRAEFIAPAYYLSMGFAVPAAIGVSMAAPSLRPIVLVGDGAFQMTGTEISTAVRLGIKPIYIILNNEGYGTMRKIRDGKFNAISQWNYTKICELVDTQGAGCRSTIASTRGQLDGAITAALGSNSVQVIEARLPRNDMSPQLKNMTTEMARLRGAQNP
jgi:indolepyruvate decarboxylase